MEKLITRKEAAEILGISIATLDAARNNGLISYVQYVTEFSPRMRRADIEVPNLPVDVDSWGRSACYPRGSFYPLSDGPPTRYHRITKPDFRPCSTCRSRSQAPFCLCTLRTISDRSEGTFGRLRYFLGGDRPSQTAHLTMSSHQIHGILLEPQYCQGGIPRMTPLRLTP